MTKRILKVSAKCSDMFDATLITGDNNIVGERSGYVPKWFPNPHVSHYGDYVVLEIDLDTGHILNWKKPTKEDISETFEKADT